MRDGDELGGGCAAIFYYSDDARSLCDALTGVILPLRSSRQLCITNENPGRVQGFMLILSRAQREPTSH